MSPIPHDRPLTPLAFLERAAAVFPDREAVRTDGRSWTWAEFADEAQSVAAALAARIEPGDRVATLAPNVPALLLAHFAVPLAHGALVTINTRLSAPEVAYILEHSGARILLVDDEFLDTAQGALAGLDQPPLLVGLGEGGGPGVLPYAALLAESTSLPRRPWTVDDENRVIAINYTSGTTGRPKGVMYTHRGAYLNSLGFAHHSGFDGATRYLWTLPMFHCNGWCAPWAVTAAAGLHLLLRAVRPDDVWRAVDEDGVTHLCGAPTVLAILADAPQAHPLPSPIRMIAGGAPPAPALIARLKTIGVDVMHAYGLTEVYGPYTICEPQVSWAELDDVERATRMARQGVPMLQSGGLRIVDAEGRDVPRDGRTLGEILMQGNNVMLGYFRDEEETARVFRDGWFHSGDLGVMHPDGYIEVKDRAKDVIISGGENISSIEVENALLAHPDVADAAVVAVPHEKWGERPFAVVVRRGGSTVDEAELLAHVRGRLAAFKVPDRVEFRDALPRTSTGKVLKREVRASLGA